MHVQVTIKLRKKTYRSGEDPGTLDQVLDELAGLSDKLQVVQERVGKPYQQPSLHSPFSVVICMLTSRLL